MIRLLGFLIKLAIIVALAAWLADRPGTARIIWHGYVIETSAAVLGLGTLGIAFVFYLVFRFWHVLRHGPERWRMHRKLGKLRQGQDNLTSGLIAVASGNAAEAGRLAINARKLLGSTAATQLLQAQAAQLAGDNRAAREIFRALASNNESAVLGYRGLIMEARRAQDWQEVNRLADELARKKPNTPWLNLVRFESAARKQDWDAATLALSHAARLMEPSNLRQNRAAVMIASSQAESKQDHTHKALQLAEQAAKQAYDWLPAIINLARQQMAAGHARAAHRTIVRNWDRMPHPQLAAIYRGGDMSPLEAYKHITQLCHHTEDTTVSRIVMAEAALAADIWGEARRHLMALINKNTATRSAYRMMARLERRESGNETAAAQWLMKAVDAPADPVWLCRSCGGAHEEWQAACKHCGTFNSLDWQSPGESRSTRVASPLLWIE